MIRKCRFMDCPTVHRMAKGDEPVTCATCRDVMGLLPLLEDRDEDDESIPDNFLSILAGVVVDRDLTAAHQPTQDYSDILAYLHALGSKQPGRPFQFVLADVREQIYANTGKWDDRDVEEIGNDEWMDAIQDLIKEQTIE